MESRLTQELRQEILCICMNWLLHVRMELFQFSFVDIHDCLVCPACQVLGGISRDGKIQAHSDGEEEIRVLEGEVRSARRHRARPTDI